MSRHVTRQVIPYPPLTRATSSFLTSRTAHAMMAIPRKRNNTTVPGLPRFPLQGQEHLPGKGADRRDGVDHGNAGSAEAGR